MKVGVILIAMAMSVVATASAYATTRPMQPGGYGDAEADAYGFVLNTDGGTFDGLALIDAVRTSQDASFRSVRTSDGPVQAGVAKD